MDAKVSRLLINGFIKKNKINMDEYENVKYLSFNDFFSREVRKECRFSSENINDLISPCDGKLTVYKINSDSVFQIKNSLYNIDSLLQDKTLAGEYINGVCLIFRLTPDDYHRYCYIDNGEILAIKKINGVLHTVRPIALQHYNIYKMNSRECTIMKTDNFGKVIQIEVGALFVGRIKNKAASGFFNRKGEKGLFEFGGSTVILLFQNNKIIIDDIIYSNTMNDKETIVKMGCKIGEISNIKEKKL
ncbi:MAG: phosphatidylserine decarboxylase [Treponema sp.]|nr:phosphatidylserine decarboxylase [Treponema sp.]